MNDFLKEKELLLNSIEENTAEHWKNYYKDVSIDCIYDDLVIDINEIKRLQQENQLLKEENEKLKNNWNELKAYLIVQQQKAWDKVEIYTYDEILSKMEQQEEKEVYE